MRSSWSGIPFYFLRALGNFVDEIVRVSELNPRSTAADQEKAARYLDLLQARSVEANRLLRAHADADAVLIFHPPDAAFLDTDIPIVIVHDATWKQVAETYPSFAKSDLADETYASRFQAERLAFTKAQLLLFLTPWAANAVAEEYPDCRDKVRVMLPGANLDTLPGHLSIDRLIERRRSQECRVLFMGADGFRKGLDIAVGCAVSLSRRLENVVLDVVGANISRGLPHSVERVLRQHGFLDKEDPDAQIRIAELLSTAFALLLPSRAECAGIVLCEAAGFGVPALTSGVGGTRDLVLNNRTGYVLGPGASGRDYAIALESLWANVNEYRQMCVAARQRYDTTLNRSTAAQQLEGWLSR